jgi:sulfite reductase alpha subunit-like flavoprotein
MFPTQVHITVAVVKFTTPFKKIRHGMCSSWLSKLTDVSKGVTIPIWIRKGTMKFPPIGAPVLLIGPGTGLAPFRSLIQERAVHALSGNHQVGQTVLFFGNRNRNNDYLYGTEFEHYEKNCPSYNFSVITAFSRDQSNKIYVQHRIRQQAKLIWDMIHNKGAIVYVAGNAKQMPTNVRDAIKDVLKQEGSLTDDQAEQYVAKLEQLRRYQQETWS